ncbi:2'-5' RNA ligase family protein [Sphingomonas lycopersici]|uniref:2'-5' RNA ligase family protein n=1 Tax=Sphingomonas lycopersici TaxID=2951807 RepID=A0AA42CU11_9SPHN|nr:2'-5' RNA ligase family protein [Sphingomonas lycopersici]MCW6534948.1 2'-5' RNA ligase family protein [Sphingomonas lycopersici]
MPIRSISSSTGSKKTLSAAAARHWRAMRAFRRSLIRHLARSGLILPTRRFNPHVTLAYGQDSDHRVTIDPIGWTVDELLLIRSGDGRHVPFGRWSLIQRQPNLPLF